VNALLVLHSIHAEVAAPFGLTFPFDTADVVRTEVAAVVVAVGMLDPAAVVKLHTVEYGLVPAMFVALTCQKYVVLAARPLTTRVVVVNVASSRTSVLNVELVETCNLYVAAPSEAFQETVTLVG
jgi:hypothetical protein